jgi:hypothetical protein
LERAAYNYFERYPFWRFQATWATEVAAFHKHPGLTQCKVDTLVFEGPDVDLLSSICVFFDGSGHFPWDESRSGQRSATEQRDRDERISKLAAEQGFKILRIHEDDIHCMLSMIEAAWPLRVATHGWVYVSQLWNYGTHLEPAVKVRCP